MAHRLIRRIKRLENLLIPKQKNKVLFVDNHAVIERLKQGLTVEQIKQECNKYDKVFTVFYEDLDNDCKYNKELVEFF